MDYQNEQVIADVQTEKLYKDSDGDGLKDWEEDLWGTDPNNPDTNKDGLTDLIDIRSGINPLGKGLDDKLATDTLQKKVNPSIESDLSETDKFSRELFAKFVIAQQQNGGTATTSDYAALLYDYIQNAEKGDIITYKETDLKQTAETDESLHTYGNALGKIIREMSIKYPGSEIEILKTAFKAGGKKEVSDFDKPIARYTSIRDSALLLTAPVGILSIHTKIVNLLGIMAVSVNSMRYTLSDPVKAMSGMSMYPETADLLIKAFKELSDYLISHNITFDKSEDGYDFSPK